MRMSRVFVAMLILTGVGLHAQTVDEIVGKYIEARGGYEKIKSVNTIKISGKQMEGMTEIAGFMIKKRPNLVYVEADYQGAMVKQLVHIPLVFLSLRRRRKPPSAPQETCVTWPQSH